MLTFLKSKITREHLEPFIQAHASSKRTLDIGCAGSPYSKYFPNRVGFDITPGAGVDVVGDAHHLPFKDGEFEQILCTEVLEHLHTPEQAIVEMRRVLAPGGTLILTTRFVFPIHDAPHDYFRYTKYGLHYLLRDWEAVTVAEEAGTAETLGILIQRMAYQSDWRGGRGTKAAILLLARIIPIFGALIRVQYGTRNSTTTLREDNVMVSGYYVEAQKHRG